MHRARADADTLLREAARLLDTAASLALSLGDAGRAIELAERAYGLTEGAAPELTWLLTALVEGGSVRRAGALARRVDELDVAGLDPDALVTLRILLSGLRPSEATARPAWRRPTRRGRSCSGPSWTRRPARGSISSTKHDARSERAS